MEQLQNSLKVLLANVYAISLKSQNYHWNVTGPSFSEYHLYFGAFYAEVSASIDTIAECLRTTGAFAPGSFQQFAELNKLEDELLIPVPRKMFERLARDNDTVIELLYTARQLAEANKQSGIVNFVEDRITIHEKHRWQLKSFIT